MPKDGGLYFDWVDFPIKDTSMEALIDTNGPSQTAGISSQLGEQARYFYENTDYAWSAAQ
jgi:hypothetical protein